LRLAALLPGASAGDTGDGSGDTGDGGGYLGTADKVLQSVRGKLQGRAALAAPQMAASAWLRSRVPLRQVRLTQDSLGERGWQYLGPMVV
jgi:hypothetical protein